MRNSTGSRTLTSLVLAGALAVGLAAPLFNSEKYPIGSLSITVPKARFSPKGQAKLVSQLLNTAGRLNYMLGSRN